MTLSPFQMVFSLQTFIDDKCFSLIVDWVDDVLDKLVIVYDKDTIYAMNRRPDDVT
jgi:hypothetical protein